MQGAPQISIIRLLLGMESYLWAFRTSHCHENVVKIGAAPSQHVHSHFVPFLSQFVDGVFRAERANGQMRKTNKWAVVFSIYYWWVDTQESNPLFGTKTCDSNLEIFILLLLKRDLCALCTSHLAAKEKGKKFHQALSMLNRGSRIMRADYSSGKTTFKRYQPNGSVASVFYVVLNQRGSHVCAEVMVGVCCKPEVSVYQRCKWEGLVMGGQF